MVTGATATDTVCMDDSGERQENWVGLSAGLSTRSVGEEVVCIEGVIVDSSTDFADVMETTGACN